MTDTILKYADEADILLPVVIVLLIIIYAKRVVLLMDHIKMRKINTISSLLSNSDIDESVSKVIKSEINNLAFEHTVGIKAGTFLREQLIDLHNSNNYDFSWKRLRMADYMIDIRDKKIIVDIQWYHHIYQLSSFLGMILSVILFYIAIVLLLFNESNEMKNIITYIVCSLGSAGAFFLFTYSMAGIYHAKGLACSLTKIEEKEMND